MLTAQLETPATERLARLEQEIAELRTRLDAAESHLPSNQATFCVLSGDYERVLAALMMAHMAVALEMEVTLFFTFWGVQAIRKSRQYEGKTLIEKALGAMLKPDIRQLPSAKFNFGGMGPAIFEHLMRQKKIATPAELLAEAGPARIRLVACTTSLDVFGISRDELLPEVSYCGAAEYLETASRSKVSLLI